MSSRGSNPSIGYMSVGSLTFSMGIGRVLGALVSELFNIFPYILIQS